VGVSRLGDAPPADEIAGLTVDWNRRIESTSTGTLAAATILVGAAIAGLWFHFA
jgi:hypothetical protein